MRQFTKKNKETILFKVEFEKHCRQQKNFGKSVKTFFF